MNALGTQILLELKRCSTTLLNDLPYIRGTLLQAASEVGATVVGQSFHQFSPHGVTGVVAIAESHLCIHTWPEYGYAAVDIFTCGDDLHPEKAVDLLISNFECEEHSVTELRRGFISQTAGAIRG